MATAINATSESDTVSRNYERTVGSFKTYAGTSNTTKIDDYNLAQILSPYSFVFSKGPKTYKEALQKTFSIKEEDLNDDKNILSWLFTPNQKKLTGAVASRASMLDEEAITNYMLDEEQSTFSRFSVEDTSLGGNEAINCRPAFGRDDDIIHPQNAIIGNPDLGGLGRVYHELYSFSQQVMYLTAGVPEFSDLLRFYNNCADMSLAGDVNSGEASWAKMFGAMAGGALKLAIKLAIFPVVMLDWLAELLDPASRVTRYYELRPSMAMYYRYVNSLFSQLAVLLGMVENPWFMKGGSHSGSIPFVSNALAFLGNIEQATLGWLMKDNKAGTGGATHGTQGSKALSDLYQNSTQMDNHQPMMPLFMQKTGPSAYRILSKRDYRYGLQNAMQSGGIDSDDYLEAASIYHNSDGGLFDGWSNRLMATMCGADKFIGFRINKNVDSTETFSNQTGQPSVASAINSAASKGRDARFSAGGSINKFVGMLSSIPGVGAVMNTVADFGKGLISQASFSGIASAVLTGSGFVDIPDIWTGSSMTKNYSFSFTFRATAGDNAAVLQDCYFPLCCILALACPRSVGMNAYTSPFLIRAYAKGMFGIPLGIIDSLTITRGASEFGWNMSRLPTVIKVNCSIKDLAPIMHLAVTTGSDAFSITGNTPMQDYLLTMAGVSISERLLFSTSLARRFQLATQLTRTTWLDPVFWATSLGSSMLGRIYGAFSSVNLLPK